LEKAQTTMTDSMKRLKFAKTGKVVLTGQDYWRFKNYIHELDGWRCKICNSIAGLTISHMVKRSRVRMDTPENCYSACVLATIWSRPT
jgi:hypothetical protein